MKGGDVTIFVLSKELHNLLYKLNLNSLPKTEFHKNSSLNNTAYNIAKDKSKAATDIAFNSVTSLPFAGIRSSMTIEAAVAIPVYIIILAFFLFMFRVMTVESKVTECLGKTVRLTAISSNKDSWDSFSKTQLMMEMYWAGGLEEWIDGGLWGVSLADSYLEDDRLHLVATYGITFPVDYLGRRVFHVNTGATARLWTGWQDFGESKAAEYVYITPNGNAYHKTAGCSTLDLSISAVKASDISGKRNKNGEKYKKCNCVKGDNDIFFITDYGDKYHSSTDCPSLKRTVYRVSIDEVGDRHPCKKCYGDTE